MKTLIKLLFLLILISCNNPNSRIVENNPPDTTVTKVEQEKFENEDRLALKTMSFNSTSSELNDDSFAVQIDNYVLKCMDSNSTTIGMIECYRIGTIKLDTLIKYKFEEIYSKLDGEDKLSFKTSHDNWLRFFGSESKFLQNSFYTWANYSQYGHGREHSITQAQWRFQIARQRLIALSNYNDQLYTEGK
jgi:hypothetical protein